MKLLTHSEWQVAQIPMYSADYQEDTLHDFYYKAEFEIDGIDFYIGSHEGNKIHQVKEVLYGFIGAHIEPNEKSLTPEDLARRFLKNFNNWKSQVQNENKSIWDCIDEAKMRFNLGQYKLPKNENKETKIEYKETLIVPTLISLGAL